MIWCVLIWCQGVYDTTLHRPDVLSTDVNRHCPRQRSCQNKLVPTWKSGKSKNMFTSKRRPPGIVNCPRVWAFLQHIQVSTFKQIKPLQGILWRILKCKHPSLSLIDCHCPRSCFDGTTDLCKEAVWQEWVWLWQLLCHHAVDKSTGSWTVWYIKSNLYKLQKRKYII